MKVVILAGGLGTRLSEETQILPKPMVKIGGKPILWHIMKIYSHYGHNDFIICCGYKGEIIKEYFSNYFLNNSDVTFDLRNNQMRVHQNRSEPWSVTLVDTGPDTMTGGRLKRVRDYIGNETFHLTYCDIITDVNLDKLLLYHKSQNTLATLTAVQKPGRFGAFFLHEEQNRIHKFHEKPVRHNEWINSGYFVLEPKIFDYIEGDQTTWEHEPLDALAGEGQLSAFRHGGFFQTMDTLKEKNLLEEIWNSGNCPWKTWDSKVVPHQ